MLARAPRADDADIITPFRMSDNQQFPLVRMFFRVQDKLVS